MGCITFHSCSAMTIAVLGTGLMGRSFALHLLSSGQQVQVWNRRANKAKALEASGAVAYGSAAEAVAGVERIHLSLADDGAVDDVLESIAGVAPRQAPIIDHSTTGPGPTAKRSALWAERGHIYLHAPVFMAPENAAAGTGFMLLSGNPDHCALVLPALEAMASKVVNLGPDPGRAAAFKLMGKPGPAEHVGGRWRGDAPGRSLRHCSGGGGRAVRGVQSPGDVLPERARRVACGP